MKALADDLARVGVLTLDAHHDVREFYAGPSNGTPIRGLIEDGLDGRRIVQVGIGALSNSQHYRAWAEDHGITLVSARQAQSEGVGRSVERHLHGLAQQCDWLYVDIDLDVLDSAFAMGSPGARPGGLLPQELHDAAFAAGRHRKVRAIDLVEVDSGADLHGVAVDNMVMCFLFAAAGLAVRAAR